MAEVTLLHKLPEDMRSAYEEIFRASDSEEEVYLRRLVKAADKISAYIKCIDEENAGNNEFSTAKEATARTLEKLRRELPEVEDFMREFLPAFGRTLDELLG